MSFSKNEKGQGLVEYALILVLVAIVVIVVLTLLQPQIGEIPILNDIKNFFLNLFSPT